MVKSFACWFVCLFVCFVIACHCKITAYVGDNKLILIFMLSYSFAGIC